MSEGAMTSTTTNPVNEPISAWAIMVYLRDLGFYLWLGPSAQIYGGFAARIEKYTSFSGYFLHASTDAETIQEAAWKAAEQVTDMAGFLEWYPRWKRSAFVENANADNDF
jgi:hypothetical protein